MPGKKYELAIRISLLRACGSPRGTRARCRGDGAGCRGSRTSRSARRRAAARRGVGKQRHVAALELHELVDRPDALHRRARSAPSSGPSTRTAKSTRGGFWPRRVHVVDDVDAADEGDRARRRGRACGAAAAAGASGTATARPRAGTSAAARRPRAASRSSDARQVVLARPSRRPARAPSTPRCAARTSAAATIAPDVVVGEDVGLEPDLALRRRRSRATSAGKVLAAAAQQRDRDCPARNRFIARAARPCRTWRPAPRGRRSVPTGNA